MNYRELLQKGVSELEQSGNPEAEVDAWFLLEFITGMRKQDYFLKMNEPAKEKEIGEYGQILQKRKAHIPLQYITGTQEFMGLEFFVDSSVLIPRQDTETLVERALKIVEPQDEILDMCTGSGCILISLLKNRVGAKGTGVDVSEPALETAKKNALHNGIEAKWVCSDLFSEVEDKFDVIVSNPPYIATQEIETLMPEVVKFEPWGALDGHEDGLFFYKKILEEARSYLKGKKYLLFEIGYDQGGPVSDLMRRAGFFDVEVIRDYSGNDRVVMGHL